jgi:hypothetical protein
MDELTISEVADMTVRELLHELIREDPEAVNGHGWTRILISTDPHDKMIDACAIRVTYFPTQPGPLCLITVERPIYPDRKEPHDG